MEQQIVEDTCVLDLNKSDKVREGGHRACTAQHLGKLM